MFYKKANVMNANSDGVLDFARQNSRLLIGAFAAFLLVNLAHSLSPIIGGFLIERFGLVGLGVGSFVFEFLGLFCLLIITNQKKRIAFRAAYAS